MLLASMAIPYIVNIFYKYRDVGLRGDVCLRLDCDDNRWLFLLRNVRPYTNARERIQERRMLVKNSNAH